MKNFLITGCSLIFLAGGALAQAPQAPQTPKGKGYDAFPLLQTRNIFDPTRRGTAHFTPGQQRGGDRGPRSRSNSFTLTGTMVSEGRTMAFFSGTRSEYGKVIPVGETIANYKVIAISATQVELQAEGKNTVLPVGHTIQLEGSAGPDNNNGGGVNGDAGASADDTSEAAAADSTPSTATAAPAATNDKTEVMRRLMERHAKENK